MKYSSSLLMTRYRTFLCLVILIISSEYQTAIWWPSCRVLPVGSGWSHSCVWLCLLVLCPMGCSASVLGEAFLKAASDRTGKDFPAKGHFCVEDFTMGHVNWTWRAFQLAGWDTFRMRLSLACTCSQLPWAAWLSYHGSPSLHSPRVTVQLLSLSFSCFLHPSPLQPHFAALDSLLLLAL